MTRSTARCVRPTHTGRCSAGGGQITSLPDAHTPNPVNLRTTLQHQEVQMYMHRGNRRIIITALRREDIDATPATDVEVRILVLHAPGPSMQFVFHAGSPVIWQAFAEKTQSGRLQCLPTNLPHQFLQHLTNGTNNNECNRNQRWVAKTTPHLPCSRQDFPGTSQRVLHNLSCNLPLCSIKPRSHEFRRNSSNNSSPNSRCNINRWQPCIDDEP